MLDDEGVKAQAKYEDYLSYASEEGALVFMSGWMGIDLSQYDLDEPIGNVKSNAIQSVVANYQEANEDGGEWKVRDIARLGAIGGLGPFVVGSGEQVADQLQEWVAETDVDGFNLAYAITRARSRTSSSSSSPCCTSAACIRMLTLPAACATS